MENRSNVDLIGKSFCKQTAEIAQCGNLRISLPFGKSMHRMQKWPFWQFHTKIKFFEVTKVST